MYTTNSDTDGIPATSLPRSALLFCLQDALSGNSKVMMFVNVSPASYNVTETLCSLNFAKRCRSVKLGQAAKNTEAPEIAK